MEWLKLPQPTSDLIVRELGTVAQVTRAATSSWAQRRIPCRSNHRSARIP